MSDVTKSEYASYLEELIGEVLENKPKRIGVCMLLDDGTGLLSYYGNPIPAEKGTMSWNIQADANMDLVLANADLIVSVAEDLEEYSDLDDEDWEDISEDQ